MEFQKVKGTIYRIAATQENNGFKTRKFVVFVKNERDERWSDYLLMEMVGEKCSVLDDVKTMQEVECSYDMIGRKYVDQSGSERFWIQLRCFNIMPLS